MSSSCRDCGWIWNKEMDGNDCPSCLDIDDDIDEYLAPYRCSPAQKRQEGREDMAEKRHLRTANHADTNYYDWSPR